MLVLLDQIWKDAVEECFWVPSTLNFCLFRISPVGPKLRPSEEGRQIMKTWSQLTGSSEGWGVPHGSSPTLRCCDSVEAVALVMVSPRPWLGFVIYVLQVCSDVLVSCYCLSIPMFTYVVLNIDLQFHFSFGVYCLCFKIIWFIVQMVKEKAGDGWIVGGKNPVPRDYRKYRQAKCNFWYCCKPDDLSA